MSMSHKEIVIIMKKITCDNCSSENAKPFKYRLNERWLYKDLCLNCMSDFVLKHQTKLIEVSEVSEANKKVIHG